MYICERNLPVWQDFYGTEISGKLGFSFYGGHEQQAESA